MSAFVFSASSTTDILASCKANVRCLGLPSLIEIEFDIETKND